MGSRIHARAAARRHAAVLPINETGGKRQHAARRAARLFLPALIGALGISALGGWMLTEPPATASGVRGHVSVRAAGRGLPDFNLRDGYALNLDYRGDRVAIAAVSALRSGNARALALASADFDRNGTPDIVAGYAVGSGGAITLQRGNPDAFAPTDQSVFARLQEGYDPESLLPAAQVYALPVAPDFLVAGKFSSDSANDVVLAARGGGLYLLQGDGKGGFDALREIALPGKVTALAAGEFRAADGHSDLAVGVTLPDGNASLLVLDDAAADFAAPALQLALSAPVSAIEFGGLDDDAFQDMVVASGSDVLVVHGWDRSQAPELASRVERISLGQDLRGLAVGEFAWDRAGHSEIAALTADGMVHILRGADVDTQPFTAGEAALRQRGNVALARASGAEASTSWQRGAGWIDASQLNAHSFSGVSAVAAKPLLRTNLSYREADDLMLLGDSRPRLEIVQQPSAMTWRAGEAAASAMLERTTLEVESAAAAVMALPKKLNGVRDLVVIDSKGALVLIPQAPNTTIAVDRTDDPAGAALTAASACTAAANDCSLRGAFEFANDPLNNNTTINVPANTYLLNINGTGAGGCDGNAQGDLAANQTVTLVGAGAATTIIAQTGTGPASDGDRVMCMNESFALGLTYNFSAVSFVGGRAGSAAGVGTTLGGAGIIGGEKGNALTLTNVVIANNQATATAVTNIGGGGLQIAGGDLTINSSTIGGTSAPGLYTDRTSTTTGNSQAGSGGGFLFTPSARQHTASTGTLTITGSTISRNTSSGSGGAGADLVAVAFALPGGSGTGTASISQSTFSNNQALGTGNGAGLLVESLPTTVSISSFTNNAANNHGGGVYVAGPSLLLDGTSPSINFSGNTATNGGSGVSTASTVTVAGANTSVGGDVEVLTAGTWTNNAGSTLTPTNVVVSGGTFTANNSTMNVSGNLTVGPGPVVGGTFNGNSGTVNLQGNLVLTAGGAGPATSISGGTSTFNFNGTTAQSIANGASITFFNLTDANITQPLTLNNSIAVNGALNVNGANAILSPAAAAVISGSGTLSGTGTARVSRIAATPTFLGQYTITNKTLTQLNVDYNGAGTQTINNTPAYSRLTVSGTGTKTLQGNTSITGDLNIAAATMAGSTFNFSLAGNWINAATFTPGTGTVTFAGGSGTQLLTGSTTFYNLTLNNAGATTSFGTTSTTIGNDLVVTAGTMEGGTSTIIFTGVTDNAGAISGAGAKNFHTLQINTPATITNNSGADTTIENNFTNNGTFVQGAAQTTTFATDNNADSAHAFAGAGTTTFGNVVINAANTLDAGPLNFNVVGASFSVAGTFTGNTSTATFNGAVAQSINGNGAKNFSGLRSNNATGVQLANGTAAVDAIVSGALTLTTDLSVAAGAVLQQSGTSIGAGDVIGTVRRTDLGATARSFGNVNNAITINSGTAPTQLDVTLAKAAPTPFPSQVKVVARDITTVATGGAGYSATVALRYVDPGELTGPGITESSLMLWRNNAGTWSAQGASTLDSTNNFVSLSGVTSFSEWAIAEGTDLTLTKTNSLGGTSVVGRPWNWTLAARNSGTPVTFSAGQTILTDNLPNSGLNYGAVTVQNVTNMAGSANIGCAIVASDLTCSVTSGNVSFNSNLGTSGFDVVFQANPQVAGTYANPRSGGITSIDPGNIIIESNEGNNSPSNSVTVNKASTTVAVTSDTPDPSQIGQAVQVTWTVFVSAPGAIGATLTGTVTVTDGVDSCMATATTFASQCNVTFTTAGNKNITVSYSGDSNYASSVSSPPTAHVVYTPPTIAKAFAPTTISLGASSVVTLTLSNINAIALGNARFTDTLTNMRAVGGAVTGTCVGTTPGTLAANATALSFNGITIPANGSCTVIFPVTSNTAGTWPNTTSGLITTQTTSAGTPSNTANLSVGDQIFANGFDP